MHLSVNLYLNAIIHCDVFFLNFILDNRWVRNIAGSNETSRSSHCEPLDKELQAKGCNFPAK